MGKLRKIYLMFYSNLNQFSLYRVTYSCWIELYLEMVNLLLNVIKFQRTGNWNGFLQDIRNFLPFCFAMNRHIYARNLSYYFISRLNLQDSHRNIYHYLKNGGFTDPISGLPFSKIPCDQIIETTINRSSKSTCGLSGKTEKGWG